MQTAQRHIERELACTTMQTMLNIVQRKRKVKRTLRDRADFYTPALSREQVATQTVSDMVQRFFGGSAESLVMSVPETKHLTAEELARLKQLLEGAQEGSDG